MMMKFLLFFFALSLLNACNQPSANESVEGVVKPEYKVTAKYPGKPHAPVSMKYALTGKATLNQPLDISLTFSVEQETSLLEAGYTTDSGLISADAAQQYQLGRLLPGAEKTINITIIPQQSGLNHVHVFATLNINGGQQSRSFAIPINIASDSKQLMSTTQNKSDNGMRYLPDQNVISMPAAEPGR
ncbi:hypothetical protein MNBD_GAMMA09-324 [hydrothermal vent metagenome]|uniref:Uncharacterized protein n=1 Tax=hydrothermal vent metagenome TaxID=652676 RepID=A0A3B0XGM3_9ZZZZ